MFERIKGIKGAIDRTIAEEQAKAKALADQREAATRSSASGSTARRSVSTSRNSKNASPARRPRPSNKTSHQDSQHGIPDTDPAVFEAAFVIDDDDQDSTISTPNNGAAVMDSDAVEKVPEGDPARERNTPSPSPAGKLPPEVRAKLKKLEKMETAYGDLLRSYRIAHAQVSCIPAFEKILREHTPLTTIKDPDAFVEFLKNTTAKSDMVMDEYKRVSTEKDGLKKKLQQTEEELAAAKTEIVEIRMAQESPSEKFTLPPDIKSQDDKDGQDASTHSRTASASKSPMMSTVLGMFSPRQKPADVLSPEAVPDKEDQFSFEVEKSQFEQQLVAKTEEIQTLQAEVASLKKELSTVTANNSEAIERLQAETEAIEAELSALKQENTDLAERLDKATSDLSEAKSTIESYTALQAEADKRLTEIQNLTKKLEDAEDQLRKLNDQDAEKKKQVASLQEQLDARTTQQSKLLEQIGQHRITIRTMESETASNQEKMTRMEAELVSVKDRLAKATTAAMPPPKPAVPEKELQAGNAAKSQPSGSKKKSKNKNKKGGAAAVEAAVEPVADPVNAEDATPAPSVDVSALEKEISELKQQVSEKEQSIERLLKNAKDSDLLKEEIENLKDNLLHIGQDSVDVKERLKTLQAEKAVLEASMTALEDELTKLPKSAGSECMEKVKWLVKEFDTLNTDRDGLQKLSERVTSLQSELGASQQLAQSRFKEITDLKEILQKAQPELKSLRADSETLKMTKDQLASKISELLVLEGREKNIKAEMARVKQEATDRDTEMERLREKLATENKQRLQLENEKRVAGRDLRRSEAEKVEISAREEKATRELEKAQEELKKMNPRIKALTDEVAQLKKESETAREELQLKTSQYANAQSLLGSMRDQTTELGTQLKEAQAKAESLDEELAECQKLLAERTREAESMRRLLKDADERADVQVREMRARLDAAVEERDRIEDESSTLARKKSREVEELRGRIRDLERESKALANERDDLEQREKEWRRRREELESLEQTARTEMLEMQGTVAALQESLTASEQQVRDAERRKADMQRMMEDLKSRYSKAERELKAAQQSRLSPAVGVSGSGRSSMDSGRSGAASNGAAAGAVPNVVYIKTIMLQFLEQKDNKLRAQLVPVLGKLLSFDTADEKKWLAVVQQLRHA